MGDAIIRELWVINSSGVPLYNQYLEESCDPTLFSGFIVALHQFAKQLDSGGCKSIHIASFKLSFIQCPDSGLLIACRSEEGVKEGRIHKYLTQIRDRFQAQFGKVLRQWEGDVKIFADFAKVANLRHDAENFLGVTLDKAISKDIISQL